MPGHNPLNPAVDELEPVPDRVRIGALPGGSPFPWGIVQRDQCNGRTLSCVNCGEALGERHKVLCHARMKARKDATPVDPPWVEHAPCTWHEVPPCVYCVEHGVRLFQGALPAERDPELAAKRAACSHDEHVMDEDGNEHGQGFYWLCADCGYRGWYD